MPAMRSKMTRSAGFLPALVLVVVLFFSYSLPVNAAPASSTVKTSLPPPVPCPGCWQPALNTSWQWQLSGKVDQSFNVVMYDIDMFDNPASVVQSLHAAGRIVICYIDAGTWEKWRPDAKEFPKSVLGRHTAGRASAGWIFASFLFWSQSCKPACSFASPRASMASSLIMSMATATRPAFL